MSMQISVRNLFSGTISAITVGAVNAEVTVALPGGDRVVAAITCESLHHLGMTIDMPVVALVKATQIILVSDFAGYRLSARNQLPAQVTGIKSTGITAEIELELRGGQRIVASVSHASVQHLAIHKGDTVTAVFKAGAVMLGLPSVSAVPSDSTNNPDELL